MFDLENGTEQVGVGCLCKKCLLCGLYHGLNLYKMSILVPLVNRIAKLHGVDSTKASIPT